MIGFRPLKRWIGFTSLLCLTCLGLVLPAIASARNANHTGHDNFGVYRQQYGGGTNVFPSGNSQVAEYIPVPAFAPWTMPYSSAMGDVLGGGRDTTVWSAAGQGPNGRPMVKATDYLGNVIRTIEFTGVSLTNSTCNQYLGGQYSGWAVIVGDWDGNGSDSAGIFCNGLFHLRNSNTSGASSYTFTYGIARDMPVAGDWNGDGKDSVGVYRTNGNWHIRTTNAASSGSNYFQWGWEGPLPLAGDWNNDGISTPGVYRRDIGQMWLSNRNSAGGVDASYSYGNGGDDYPFAADWDGL